MDSNSLRILRILEEIEKDQVLSQRGLARNLNISLGLANISIRRLAEDGLLRVATVPKSRLRYAITARGASEKRRLTHEYIRHSYDFYRNVRRRLRSLLGRLEEAGVRHIVLYGVSCLAEITYISVQETSIEIAAIADDQKQGHPFFGLVAIDPSHLLTVEYDRLLITADDLPEDAAKRLRGLGISRSKVVMAP